MRKLLSIMLISALLLAACNKGNVDGEPNNIPNTLKIEDFFPLTENAKYTYNGEGNEFASYTVYIDYVTDNRIQTRTNNGASEIVRVLEINNGQLTELFSRAETYFRENFTDDEYTGGKVLLKEPLKEGNSWSLDENSTTTITGISKEVVTPQGNFETIEVTTENSQGTTIEYYAKDKGLVKSITKGEGYEVSSTLADIENNVPLVQTVTLFYPDIDGINLNTVDVQVSFNTNDEPKDVIEQMVKDLSFYEMLSKNTKINELYFNEKENSVHVDLSKEFVTEMNAGAAFEGLILQSVANTLGTYYGVQNIFLTIDGGPYESGHILLEEGEPLTADYSNIKTAE
jgi:predicted DNA binding CopG/RHH family protein